MAETVLRTARALHVFLAMTMTERLAEETSTAELLQEAIAEAKNLVRVEVELAQREAKEELAQLERAAIGFGIAVAATLIVLCMLATALVLALGGTAVAALLVAAGFLVLGGVAAFVGYRLMPKSPFERTRRRLDIDVTQLKERLA